MQRSLLGRWMMNSPPSHDGLHAPMGTLVRDTDNDLVLCHVCGRWYRALGSHVRVHGLTADAYRQAFGLFASKALSSRGHTEARRAAQSGLYRRSARTRTDLGQGHRMARSGELADLASRQRPISPQRRAAQLRELAAGRRTRTATAEARLRDNLRELGFPDVRDGLVKLYIEQQNGIEELATLLRVSRAVVRRSLTDHGIEVRHTGVNSDAGKHSRVQANIAAAAALVGTTDLHRWLTERRAEGWTLARLAAALKRSIPWVRARLAEPAPPDHVKSAGAVRT
ncbi:MucR family transcriptional regulator [Nonomuraea sp. NPDC050153]|uniref:MucR family transcriptional regulator n=1 Tax=Nonomuraea sp. NPDC050153 TaxID=3364359 RepID=UPI0037A6ACFF